MGEEEFCEECKEWVSIEDFDEEIGVCCCCSDIIRWEEE